MTRLWDSDGGYGSLCEQWLEMGGVPDDLSTKDVAAGMLLKLFVQYRRLEATLTEIVEGR